MLMSPDFAVVFAFYDHFDAPRSMRSFKAIARTATNVKSGGRTPVAGIIHAFTLLLITLSPAGARSLVRHRL